jgi:hypothetical protein
LILFHGDGAFNLYVQKKPDCTIPSMTVVAYREDFCHVDDPIWVLAGFFIPGIGYKSNAATVFRDVTTRDQTPNLP